MRLLFKPLMLRRYAAEFVGTYAYVLFGCGVSVLVGGSHRLFENIVIALAFGFALFVMTFALNHISAAPFNPAIVFGLAIAGHFPWRYIWFYWLAQVGGAMAAIATLSGLLSRNMMVKAHYGAPIPAIGDVSVVVLEAIMTFFLMQVVMSSATDRRVGRGITGLASGLTVTLAIMFSGPLSGGSLNPARGLAPALFVGGTVLASVWMYWLGPLLGATASAFVYEWMRGGKEHALDVPEGIFEGIPRYPVQRK